ncbi:MAG TPA: hypothetical protein VFW04_02275 [Gemmatimonadaceae bacterium]|nr:hypothetical protein [Gemmatimonadaceae bacterium]
MSTDWDKELRKIDQQLESLSDDALLPQQQAKGGGKPAKPGKAAPAPNALAAPARTTSTLGVMARLLLAIALGVGIMFWPYSTKCGMGLFGYLAASVVVIVAGGWSAIWTWRHRSASGHVLSLLLILWGALLAAQQVLPRIGYAKPDLAHPAIWMCG